MLHTTAGYLRSKVLHEPVVLVTAHSKVSVVGKVDHVGWPHIDRVPQGAVGIAGTCQDRGGIA